ncbi:MAG: glycosyltransferase family 2 protein [bacterium]|nr:glycosyltransferase family 2 protein [bacterium]
MRTVVIIPAYNEAQTVAEVVRRVRERCARVIVVDDGSRDGTGELARGAGAEVVRHAVNRGLGAALGTGIAAALARGATCIVTMDADGQHDPTDIAELIAPIERGGADLVIGTRWHHAATAPLARQLANRTANLVTRVLFGVRCSDTQSGFRAIARAAAERLDLRTNRMEVSSEILAEAARLRLRIAEVPIQTIYTAYSLSKGQGLVTGAKTAWGLMLRRMF